MPPKSKKQTMRGQKTTRAVAPKAKSAMQPARAKQARNLPFDKLPMYLKCVIDPFTQPACGVPDNYGGKTFKNIYVDEYSFTPDAAGNILFCVAPALSRAMYYSTVTAGVIGNATTPYTAHPDYASLSSNFDQSRLACFGVEVTYIGATAAAAGSINVIEDVALNYWTGATVTSIMDDGQYAPAFEGVKRAMVPRMEPRYDTDTNNVWMTPTFPYLHVAAVGLPTSASPLLRVRVTRHIEALVPKTNATLRAATAKVLSEPSVLAAVSALPEDMPTAQSGWKTTKETLTRAAWDGLSTAVAPLARQGATRTVEEIASLFGAWML